jgi:hypothetical protein
VDESTTIKRDTDEPTATLMLSTFGYTKESSTTLNLTCEDDYSGVASCELSVSYNGGAFVNVPHENGNALYDLTVYGDGTYEFKVDAADNAGNVHTTPVTYDTTILRDTVAPETTASGVPSGWVSYNINIGLSATDEADGYVIASGVDNIYACVYVYPDTSCDSAPISTTGTDPKIGEVSVSQEGNNTLKYYATDILQNQEILKTAEIKIDKSLPEITAYVSGTLSPCNDDYRANSATVTLNATDSVSGIASIEYKLDGGEWTLYDPVTRIVITKLGQTTVSFRAKDYAENEKGGLITVKVDKDSDGDGVYDECDQCPKIGCSINCAMTPEKCALFKGCPSAINVTATTFGFNSTDRHAKLMKKPMTDLLVRVYNKTWGSCAANYGLSWGFTWQVYKNITDNCEPVSYCVTDENGNCVVGVPEGQYLLIGNELENGTEVRTLGRHVFTFNCNKHLGSNTDDDDEDCGWDYSKKPYQRNKCCGVMRKVKLLQFSVPDLNDGRNDGEHNNKQMPGNSKKIKGSLLEVFQPDYVVWSGTEELYPFVFTSDSDWDVDVCLSVPVGYTPVEGCMQTFVANESKSLLFRVIETGSVPGSTGVNITLKHLGKTQKLKSMMGSKMTPALEKIKARERARGRGFGGLSGAVVAGAGAALTGAVALGAMYFVFSRKTSLLGAKKGRK